MKAAINYESDINGSLEIKTVLFQIYFLNCKQLDGTVHFEMNSAQHPIETCDSARLHWTFLIAVLFVVIHISV